MKLDAMLVLSDIAEENSNISSCYRYELLRLTPEYLSDNLYVIVSFFAKSDKYKNLIPHVAARWNYILVGYELILYSNELKPIALSDNIEELLVMADVNNYSPLVNKAQDF